MRCPGELDNQTDWYIFREHLSHQGEKRCSLESWVKSSNGSGKTQLSYRWVTFRLVARQKSDRRARYQLDRISLPVFQKNFPAVESKKPLGHPRKKPYMIPSRGNKDTAALKRPGAIFISKKDRLSYPRLKTPGRSRYVPSGVNLRTGIKPGVHQVDT